jgi:branched-chain amino acid transport system ATP-binding protein
MGLRSPARAARDRAEIGAMSGPAAERLRLDGVTVRFGGVVAARDVSLAVPPGEIRGLIGPNGAGKTTLINAITGAVALAAGRILLDGAPISGQASHTIARRGVGRTFQHVEAFHEMSVIDNVLVGVGRSRLPFWRAALNTRAAERAERAAIRFATETLDAFGLLPHRNTRASDLPFGLLKRMDLARALAARPTLLLMDEPTSGMSESEADAAITTARELAGQRGITLLVVEHNMRVMMALADRITVMQFGAIVAEGTPAEIQRNPAVIDAYLGEELADAGR